MRTKTKPSVIKEKPILMSAPMVRAILDGRKTMTRRVVSLNNSDRQASPKKFPYDLSRAWKDTGFPQAYDGRTYEYLHVPFCHPEEGWEEVQGNDTVERWYCKWEPGVRLWVREAFDWVAGTESIQRVGNELTTRRFEKTIFKADGGKPITRKWTPSIHMPRWASRITLEITGVRVERLNDITRLDCVAEGWPHDNDPAHHPLQIEQAKAGMGDEVIDDAAICWFADLWDSINGNRPGCAWNDSPWCWVIAFNRVTE